MRFSLPLRARPNHPSPSSPAGAVDYWGFLGDFDIGKPELDEEELEKRQLNELQHGRLAMIAFLELLRHDSQNFIKPAFDGYEHMITGLPFLYQ